MTPLLQRTGLAVSIGTIDQLMRVKGLSGVLRGKDHRCTFTQDCELARHDGQTNRTRDGSLYAWRYGIAVMKALTFSTLFPIILILGLNTFS
ncbi:MAG: hypothetical protein OSA11_00485 [Candidatus Nanopelagicales bacterium]|nr:hypothetical protein [Candidatus Nanopelagicales bacterium]